MLSLEQVEALKPFQLDPNLFFEKVLGCEPEEYQRRINQAVADHERVAVKACHDVGKSWDLARIVLWFGSCFPYCKIVTTAPTFLQVEQILWAEIRAAHRKSKFPLGGQMNLTKWTLDDEWFALGFTPKNEVSGEVGQGSQSTFQGFHASGVQNAKLPSGGVLVIFDEATGVPKKIWDMAEGILTQSFVKFVAIANPTSPSSEFAKCFKSAAWHKISLSCFDSPNLIANGITNKEKLFTEINKVAMMRDDEAQLHMRNYKVIKPHLLSLKWVVSMGQPSKWGVTHPLFVSKVLGEFPENADNSLIPLGSIEEAQLRVYYPTPSDRKIIGADIARFGSDSTVLTALHGKQSLQKRSFTKKDTSAVTGEILAMARDLGGVDLIVVDETGLGAGVVDQLNQTKRDPATFESLRNTEIRGVQFGASCQTDELKEQFVNIKARMFKLLADDIKASGGLCLLDEAVYLDELPTILYKYDSKGRLLIESKDDYKKRTGRKSPDDADSLALANYGRYDEIEVGSFGDSSSGFSRPFAAGLNGGRQW